LSGLITRTVKSELAEHLREEIIRGDLIPGQHLRLEEIASRFDVSTMPVREALRELEAEGIVTIFPHRGAIVTELSAEDLHDIYEIRAVLEEMATRLAVPKVTEETLTQLRKVIEQMDHHIGELVTLVKLNHTFHNTLYAASGRKHLCELTNILRLRTQHYLQAFITHLGGTPRGREEHLAILKALELGQTDQAARLIYEHVAKVGHEIVDYIRQKEEMENNQK
jgi:DNA-binding GntR family transcriptional regulator